MNMTRRNLLRWSTISTGSLVFGTALPACGGGGGGGGSSGNSASPAFASTAPVFTANFVASRVSGVAPLYVNFDATGTIHPQVVNPTHELFYSWTFGDAGAGNWANGVQSAGLTSKNSAFGPVTGHVFETPGTYVVDLIVMDGVNTKTKSVSITVQDPNLVYAGANTICISHSGNFTGAPSGADLYTTPGASTDMFAAWNAKKASNKRILFCKADTWTISATISAAGLYNGILGGYGTGVAHTFASGTMVSVSAALGVAPVFNSSTASDFKFCNFRVDANTNVAFQSISADDYQITWYKMEARNAYCAFSLTPNLVYNSLFKHEQTCIYECLHGEAYGVGGNPPQSLGATASNGGGVTPCVFTAAGHYFKRVNKVRLVGTPPTGFSTGTDYYISATNLTANTFSLTASSTVDTPLSSTSTATCDVIAQGEGGGQGLYVALTKGGVMGCYFDNCNVGEQTVRIPYIHTSHINNNYIARPNQTKNILKIHSRGYENIKDIPGVSGWSEKFMVSANFLDMRGGYSYGEVSSVTGRTATQVGDSTIIIMVGSPSEGPNEYLRNCIVENNFTQTCLGSPKDTNGFIKIGIPNVTVRNNILDASGGDRSAAFDGAYVYTYINFASVLSSTNDSTIGVRIYNNTVYSNLRNAENAAFVRVNAGGGLAEVDQLKVQNNLWYLPHATASTGALSLAAGAAPTNVTNTHNTDSVTGGAGGNTPNFAVTPPVLLTDWRPSTGSYAIDRGTTVPVLRDINNASRAGGTYDLGALLP